MLILNTTTAGVEKYRMLEPNLYLAKHYNFPVEILQGSIQESNFNQHKILFTHFSVAQNQTIVAQLKQIQKNGMKIVVDVDDYWEVPPSHSLHGFVKKNNIVQKTIELLKMADGITCSTKYLADKISKSNKNVVVLPNSLDPDKVKIKKKSFHKVRLGWSGGSSHHEDIKLLKDLGLNSKLSNENVQFILAGFDSKIRTSDNNIIESLHGTIWKKYEEVITNNYSIVSEGYKNHLLSAKHKKYFNEDNEVYKRVWTKSISKYLKNMNEIDIFIVPLVENEFNKYKSELKIIEAGFYKVPVIASSIQQYEDVIEHGVNGFLVKQKRAHKDFTKYVKTYVNNPDLMQQHGELLHELCMNKFNLQKNSKLRVEYFESF